MPPKILQSFYIIVTICDIHLMCSCTPFDVANVGANMETKETTVPTYGAGT